MKIAELLKNFNGIKHPIVAAASFLDISPQTIRVWIGKNGLDGHVPEQWAALYREKKAKEVKK